MAKPKQGDWNKLQRVARYLKSAPRCVLTYPWQEPCTAPMGYSDSDWAGCHSYWQKHEWRNSDDAEVLSMRSMTSHWNMTDATAPRKLFTDASAALSIAKKEGAGKMRHIKCAVIVAATENSEERVRLWKDSWKPQPS